MAQIGGDERSILIVSYTLALTFYDPGGREIIIGEILFCLDRWGRRLGIEEGVHVGCCCRKIRQLLNPECSQAQPKHTFVVIEFRASRSGSGSRTYDQRRNVPSTFQSGSFRIVP
jgi:hypothetical protein